ncbi:uncharacterized protein LOC128740847 [Sabethes cyaneus]|uniref:uncharacterized protein LOC128740847 n=1 Tax=Sabethes cyaneus TaxID=53552 RepID=UPI00237E3FD2|nr:uncharacterized protein LOC128740847 [Sabethes cyaneus]
MDETGLSGKQKITLLSAWSLIKQDLDLHCRNILLLFFKEHPHFLPYFDFSTDSSTANLSENQALFAHSMNVINGLGSLIEYGLGCPKMFLCLLTKMAKNHKARSVTGEDIKLFGKVIMNYFMDVLERQAASSLPEAFEVFFEKIAEAFDDPLDPAIDTTD